MRTTPTNLIIQPSLTLLEERMRRLVASPGLLVPSTATTSFQIECFDLLEDILLHLPLQDLFLTQGVCKQQQSMQQTSTHVRKALFPEPFHSQKVYYPSTYKPHWYLVPGRAAPASS